MLTQLKPIFFGIILFENFSLLLLLSSLHYNSIVIIFVVAMPSILSVCRRLFRLTCEVIATASQNNTKCQQELFTAVPKLLVHVKDQSLDASSRTKALYAVSSVFCPHKLYVHIKWVSLLTLSLSLALSYLIVCMHA